MPEIGKDITWKCLNHVGYYNSGSGNQFNKQQL